MNNLIKLILVLFLIFLILNELQKKNYLQVIKIYL